MPLVEIGRQRLLAAKCCIEINRGATSSIGCFVAPPSDRMNWNAPSSTRPVDIVFVFPQGHLNLPDAPNPIQKGAFHYWLINAMCLWSKSAANACSPPNAASKSVVGRNPRLEASLRRRLIERTGTHPVRQDLFISFSSSSRPLEFAGSTESGPARRIPFPG